MPSVRISKEFTSGIYYLTFTVKNWYYLFDRHNRFEILANMPKMIKGEYYLIQKTNYIHANPARKQYVKNPEDWVWLSANTEGKINIDSVV